MRPARIAVALIAVLGAGVSPASSQPVAGGGAAAESAVNGLLYAVAAVSADDVWAVGEGSHGAALIEHWDGTSWQHLAGPTLGRATDLESLSVVSPDDIWAAGTWYIGRNWRIDHAFVMHWDGQSWSQVDFHPTMLRDYLLGIDAFSDTDVYVAGGINSHSIVYHFDGTTWVNTKARHRSDTLGINGLDDIDGPSPDAMWVVGNSDRSAEGVRPMAQEWRGDHWKLVDPAIPPHGQSATELKAVTSLGPDQAWSVGDDYDATGLYGLVEQWDGSTWSVSPVRGLTNMSSLSDVAASSGTDAWAVGTIGWNAKALIAHWDGTSWRRVPTPRVDGHPVGGYLSGVAAVSSDDAWAVGWDPSTPSVTILHWDGSTWTSMNP